MSSTYTELRSQSSQVDTQTVQPTTGLSDGRTYFDTSSGIMYVYTNSSWKSSSFTTTSTSTSTTSSSSTSTSSTSTSSTSTSTTTTSTSTTSSSTSTTL